VFGVLACFLGVLEKKKTGKGGSDDTWGLLWLEGYLDEMLEIIPGEDGTRF
jgi:hypothetical protein